MLEVKNIKKSFGGVKAIDDISFVVEKGESVAIIGPNGAGKTTLFDIITGLIKADSGEVWLDGKNITAEEIHKRASLGISRIFQQVRLFRNLTIADHLRLVWNDLDTKLWRNVFAPDKINKTGMKNWLERFFLEKGLETIVKELSYGQRKLMQIAMAVKRQHKILLLDEPVAGVNSVAQEQIENILLDLKKQGETIILIDHDMNFVKRLADKIVVLDAGRILLVGTSDNVINDPKLLTAYLGK
jgi:branched-chain amino acid transport system ATP-binding protein